MNLDPLTGFSGDQFTLIHNTGGYSVVGTFAGLAEGDTFTVAGRVYRISYTGGAGHDVVLRWVIDDASYKVAPSQTLHVTVERGLLWYGNNVNGDTLTVVAINNTRLVNGSITIVIASGASLTVHSDGSFDYIAVANPSYWEDDFSFTISDGLNEVTATLHIIIGGP